MRKIIDVITNTASLNSSAGNDQFQYHDPGELADGDLRLVLVKLFSGNKNRGGVPTYRFKMTRVDGNEEIGRIDLRVGDTERIVLYFGHIGYHVNPKYRGKRFATRACLLLLPLARSHGMERLWITCNPDNVPSRRTCELVGAKFVETVDVPRNSDFYLAGERQKCRYRLDL